MLLLLPRPAAAAAVAVALLYCAHDMRYCTRFVATLPPPMISHRRRFCCPSRYHNNTTTTMLVIAITNSTLECLRRCDLLLCNRRCKLLHIGTASMARLLLLNAIVRTISHHNARYHTIVRRFVVVHVLLRRFLLLFIPKNKVTAERKLRFLSKTGDRNGKYRNPEDSGRNRQPRLEYLP